MGYIVHFLLQTTLVLLLVNVCLVFVPKPIRLLFTILFKVLSKIIWAIVNQLNIAVKDNYKGRTKRKIATDKQPFNVIPMRKKSITK